MPPTIDRTRAPETPPIPAYEMPPVDETRLRNGLTVVRVEDARFPLVSFRLSFQAGSKFDPKDMSGCSGMVAGLLTQGTKSRSFRDLAEELTSLGASLNGNASSDVLTLGGSVLAEKLPKLLDLAADVAMNASFPGNEVDLRKQNRKQALLAQRSQSDFLASEKFDALVFGDHPYALIAPTMESLDRMDRQSMVVFRDTHLVPNNAVLLLVGQLPASAATFELVEERFGSWSQKPLPAAPPKNFPESQRKLVLVNRPGSAQADIHIGRLAATRTDPDYYPLLVANAILGSGGSSRLFVDVRERLGFAYDAHSELDRRQDAGVATAVTQVRNEVVGPAINAVLGHLSELAASPVSTTELTNTQNYISGVFLIGLETQAGLADQVELVKTMGLSDDYLEMFTTCVRSVDADQIQAAARKHLSPEKSVIVVVGDASVIAKSMEPFGTVEIEEAK
jgi:zinc protease